MLHKNEKNYEDMFLWVLSEDIVPMLEVVMWILTIIWKELRKGSTMLQLYGMP